MERDRGRKKMLIGWKGLHGERMLHSMGFLRAVTCAEIAGKSIVVFRRPKELKKEKRTPGP
jgi:hypothetical protein